MLRVGVQSESFDVGVETVTLCDRCPDAGGIASFLGVVRSTADRPLSSLILEHYPAMTQAALEQVASEAMARFALLGCTVIHRFGTLLPGEAIVLVLSAAHHRRAALESTAYLIDWLKTSAPFWKKELFVDGGAQWVHARAEDARAAEEWLPG